MTCTDNTALWLAVVAAEHACVMLGHTPCGWLPVSAEARAAAEATADAANTDWLTARDLAARA